MKGKGSFALTNAELMNHAKRAAEAAYTPYSNFKVGAALITADGNVFIGCNIENASYGATNCAERTAIFKAVSEGYRDIERIAVVAADGSTAYPCGICLQVMNEFMPNGEILLEIKDEIVSFYLKELLPYGFTLN